jgi:hypothetical protein
MSAWLVSKRHIDLIVTYAIGADCDPKLATALGRALWQANNDNLRYMYGDTLAAEDQPGIDAYHWAPTEVLEDGPMLKAINCLDYQSCDRPGAENSPALQYLYTLQAAILDCYPGSREDSDLVPGYEQAPWGFS